MRQTSADAFRHIQASGLLSGIQWKVYAVLYEHGPLTARELRSRAGGDPSSADFTDSYHKRLSELKRLGCVREVGVRRCSITGRDALAWDVTANLPVKVTPVRPPSKEFLRGFEECRKKIVAVLRSYLFVDEQIMEQVKRLEAE